MKRLGSLLLLLAMAIFITGGGADAHAKKPGEEGAHARSVQPGDARDYAPGQVLVRFKPEVGRSTAMSMISAKSGEASALGRRLSLGVDGTLSVKKSYPALSRIKGGETMLIASALPTEELVKLFKDERDVAAVSPNYVRRASAVPDEWASEAEMEADLWGMVKINAPDAWDAIHDAPDLVIANIDTGVDYRHEDLAANIWTNPDDVPDDVDNDGNGIIDDVHGASWWSDDNGSYFSGDPMDDNGHGTHTSGTAAGVGNNGVVAPGSIAGVAWNTKIMALKFLDATGMGLDSDAMEAIDYAVLMKQRYDDPGDGYDGANVRVINASWGGGGYNQALEQAIDEAGTLGIVFVAAAGNSGTDNDDRPHYPAGYDLPNVISVAATEQDDAKADYSNYGRTSVDIAAPGGSVINAQFIRSTVPGTGYVPQSGDLFFDDVESGAGGWATAGTWAITDIEWHGGSHSWADSPVGNYEDDSDYSLTSQEVVLSPGHTADDVHVGFWLKCDLEKDFDYLYLQFTTDSSDESKWETVMTFTGENQDWKRYAYYLPERFRAATFQFRFRLVSDESYTYDGVYLDDIGVGVTGSDASTSYDLYRGTSMATPHVTGTIALLVAQNPDLEMVDLVNYLLGGADSPAALAKSVAGGRRLNVAGSVSTGFIPYITGVTPETGCTAGATVTITGKHFGSLNASTSKVYFGAALATVKTWTDTTITCTVPKSPGRYLKVVNAAGASHEWAVSVWQDSPAMATGRDSFASVTLNGKVYVLGGEVPVVGQTDTWEAIAACEVFNPATGLWTGIAPMNTPRSSFAAAVVNGLIYVIGGWDPEAETAIASVECYNPTTNAWTYKTAMNEAISWPKAAAVGSLIYLSGGLNSSGQAVASLWEFNPAVGNGSWTQRQNMATARYEHGLAAVGGKLYAFGGRGGNACLQSVEEYNPSTNTWTGKANMPLVLARMGVATNSTVIYAAGGANQANTDTNWWNSVTRHYLTYTPGTNTWAHSAEDGRQLPTAKLAAELVFVKGQGLYSMGGTREGLTFSTVEKLAMGGVPNLVPVRSLLLGN